MVNIHRNVDHIEFEYYSEYWRGITCTRDLAGEGIKCISKRKLSR